MDTKITKKRLSNFLAYEWILMIVVAVVGILLFELIYSVSAVKLTAGQKYKVFYDTNVAGNESSFYNFMTAKQDGSLFSYDVLSIGTEKNMSVEGSDMLSLKYSVDEVDMVITERMVKDTEKAWDTRVNQLIDGNIKFATISTTVSSMRSYLNNFTDTEVKKGDFFEITNLNEEKVKANFLERMKKDNRFRKDEEKAKGIKQEIERIQNLFAQYNFFYKVFEYGKDKGWFYSYKRYEFMKNLATENKAIYQELYDKASSEFWGINLGKFNVENFCYVNLTDENNEQKQSTEELVLLIVDLTEKQRDLQYESVSVINRIIKSGLSAEELENVENYEG